MGKIMWAIMPTLAIVAIFVVFKLLDNLFKTKISNGEIVLKEHKDPFELLDNLVKTGFVFKKSIKGMINDQMEFEVVPLKSYGTQMFRIFLNNDSSTQISIVNDGNLFIRWKFYTYCDIEGSPDRAQKQLKKGDLLYRVAEYAMAVYAKHIYDDCYIKNVDVDLKDYLKDINTSMLTDIQK